MKRFTVGKSKSFNVMRRSNSNTMSSSGSKVVVHSYDDLQLNHSNQSQGHGGDSDSDSSAEPMPRSPIRSSTRELVDVDDTSTPDWSSWTRSIGLPLAFSMDSTGSSGHNNMHEKRYQRMRRTTKGKFQPSYLLQRRKEALVLAQKNQQSSSSLQYLRLYSSSAHPKLRHSCVAFLFVLAACYALLTLLSSSISTKHSHTTTTDSIQHPSQPQSSSSLPYYYYYLNMKETQPMEIIAKMLTLHAYAHQLDRPAYFAGVCGYPTYQTQSQRQAMRLMEQLHLELLLPWDVCPPIEAIQNQDPHYILIEEAELVTLPRQDLFTNEWKEWMQSQRQTSFEQRQYLAMQQQSDAGLATNDNNKHSSVEMEEEALWKQLVGESVSEGNNVPLQQRQRQLQGQPSAALLEDKNNNNLNNQGLIRRRRI